MSETSEELICVGAITGARGLKGEVRIKSFTAEPMGISDYGDLFEENGRTSYQVRITGQAKGQLLAHLNGIEDRDAAESLKGIRLYVPKSALPETDEDEFYFSDLVGLRADLVDGGCLGKVKEVHDFGAGAILEVVVEGAETVMVPFTRAVVPVVDKVGGKVVVDPPIGLIEPAKSEKYEEVGDKK